MKLLAALFFFPPLAQTMPTTVGDWLENLFWLVGGTTAMVALYKMLKGGSPLPQPMVVKGAQEYATAEELRQAHGRISREREEINALLAQQRQQIDDMEVTVSRSINDLRKEIKGDTMGVHNRINEVLAAVSELKGRLTK